MENVPSERLLNVGVWAEYTTPAEVITLAAEDVALTAAIMSSPSSPDPSLFDIGPKLK